MSEIAAYLRQFDDAWSHSYESVHYALGGVTEDEAFYQAPCYAAEEHEEGWPAPGTIAWQVAHLTHCKRHYTNYFVQAGAPDRPEVESWTPVETFAEMRALLEAAHAAQRAEMAAFTDEQLDLTAGNGMPFREFLAMSIRHDTWHGAQIAVARRLFRSRG
jgi:uncharacterized damage-inducible protein DinB